MHESMKFTVPTEGKDEAQRFALFLLLEEMSIEEFRTMPTAEQVALIQSNAGMSVEEFAKALRWVGAYHLAHGDALRRWSEKRLGQSVTA